MDLNDKELQENVNAFEAAAHAESTQIIRPKIARVLLALDESNQNATAKALAEIVAGRLDVSAETIPFEGAGRPEDQILSALQSRPDSLLVLPVPFRDDFKALGRDSSGVVLDLVLSRRTAPLLVIRDPLEDPGNCLNHLTLPLTLVRKGQERAMGWAFALASDTSSTIHLLATIDEEMHEAYRGLGGPSQVPTHLDERTLSGLGQPHLAGIISAAQQEAAHKGIDCRVSIREGHVVTEIARFANESPSLIITPCPQPCSSLGSLRVAALIREARYSVLVL